MYTNVTKPTGANYTNVNIVGKQQYDQSDITYDSPTVYYDGINTTAWTSVAKPPTPLSAYGYTTWASLGDLTWDDLADLNASWGGGYTNVNKPTT